MQASALGPVSTNPEISQMMAAFDIMSAGEASLLRPSKTLETPAKQKVKQVQKIEFVEEKTTWRAWAIVGAIALVASAAIAWQFYVPRYRVMGQPLGQGAPVVMLLQGADQLQENFDQEIARLTRQLPDATIVMANAPNDSRIERRWVLGPDWNMVEASKAAAHAEIDSIIERLREEGVDDSEIYIGGYDEGGQVALDYVANHEGFAPAGLVLLSTGLPPWVLDDLSAVDGTRAFVTHGLRDGEVKVLGSDRLQHQLRDAGAEVEFFTYAGGRELVPSASRRLAEFIEADE